MSEIYLIRHTTPAVARGLCYGQTDLDVTESFLAEADIIRRHLPGGIGAVHSSPLLRCAQLAANLFPDQAIEHHDALMEIHCGDWEMRAWDELPPAEIDPWMKDFVHVRTPGGESYGDLYGRVVECFERVGMGVERAVRPVAIVSHGGVIRSILSYITGTPLIESFKQFPLYYGCVVRITGEPGAFTHEVLSNIMPPEWETHKPKRFSSEQKG